MAIILELSEVPREGTREIMAAIKKHLEKMLRETKEEQGRIANRLERLRRTEAALKLVLNEEARLPEGV